MHAGLLPLHFNPPRSQLNWAHVQQLPLQKQAMMKAFSPLRTACLQLEEKTSLSERQFDRSQVRDKSSGPFPSHPGLSDFNICQQDMLPAFLMPVRTTDRSIQQSWAGQKIFFFTLFNTVLYFKSLILHSRILPNTTPSSDNLSIHSL